MDQMTLTEIIQDIHAMDEELWHYEARYGLRTNTFTSFTRRAVAG